MFHYLNILNINWNIVLKTCQYWYFFESNMILSYNRTYKNHNRYSNVWRILFAYYSTTSIFFYIYIIPCINYILSFCKEVCASIFIVLIAFFTNTWTPSCNSNIALIVNMCDFSSIKSRLYRSFSIIFKNLSLL